MLGYLVADGAHLAPAFAFHAGAPAAPPGSSARREQIAIGLAIVQDHNGGTTARHGPYYTRQRKGLPPYAGAKSSDVRTTSDVQRFPGLYPSGQSPPGLYPRMPGAGL
jgi:hypothetical protein